MSHQPLSGVLRLAASYAESGNLLDLKAVVGDTILRVSPEYDIDHQTQKVTSMTYRFEMIGPDRSQMENRQSVGDMINQVYDHVACYIKNSLEKPSKKFGFPCFLLSYREATDKIGYEYRSVQDTRMMFERVDPAVFHNHYRALAKAALE